MKQKIILFCATFFAALGAGTAFVVWLDFRPVEITPSFYVEKMQHAIKAFTVPLPIVLMAGIFFTIIATALLRKDRKSFYFLIAASTCIMAALLITFFGNIPINNQIKTWNINSVPHDWREVQYKWWYIHTFRTIFQIAGLSLLILTLLLRYNVQNIDHPSNK